MVRQVIAVVVGAFCVVLGLFVRANAKELATFSRVQEVSPHYFVRDMPQVHPSIEIALLDFGVVLLAFGTLLLAVLAAHWAVRKPE